jgi:hypothetical protein
VIAGRVIMLSRDQGLASIAGQLVGHGRPLTCFSSPADVPDWLRPPTGVVVLDFPRATRGVVYRQLRQRYPGPVLALLDRGEDSSALAADRGRLGVLHRPFTGEELSASLDALVGSRNGARVSKSPSLTVPPVGTGTSTAAVRGPVALDTPAPAAAAGGGVGRSAVGVPAKRVAGRRVAGARRRGPAWRRMSPSAKRRATSLILTLAAAAALLLGTTLGDGRDCRGARCGNVANAIGNAGAGIPPAGSLATPQLGVQPAAGSGGGGSAKNPASATAMDPPPKPGMVIPIASGVGDLIAGTSSSSGGAPLLVVTGGSGSSSPATGGSSGSGGGSAGGGVPSSTTRPPATTSPATTSPSTSPPTTAPPTTEPPTTAPPTTDPATTSPPTTEPPTTEPPTTEPPTTAPVTTAAAPAATETTLTP